MKPVKLFHDDDVLCCLSFDDGSWVFWCGDGPLIIAFPGEPPIEYDEGTHPDLDEIMSDPRLLYEVPSERMDATREEYVRQILGIQED